MTKIINLNEQLVSRNINRIRNLIDHTISLTKHYCDQKAEVDIIKLTELKDTPMYNEEDMEKVLAELESITCILFTDIDKLTERIEILTRNVRGDN